MGYAAEKEVVEKKIKFWKRVALIVVGVLLIALVIFSCFVNPETWKYYFGMPKLRARADGEMRMHFLNVGEGDCAIIELPDGKVLMVDGGNGSEHTSTTIIRYLNALKIDTIDYLMVTHADSDHCGGLDKVVKYKKVKKAYITNNAPTINQEYAELYNALVEENCEVELATRGESIFSDREDCPYTLTVLWPYTSDFVDIDQSYTEANLLSTVFWLDYFGTSALFTGDATVGAEEHIVRDSKMGFLEAYGVALDSTEILKVAHHGSADATGLDLLTHLEVKTAVISCSRSNIYNHPSVDTCARLQTVGAQEYRTYEGHVMITANKHGEYIVEYVKA